MSFFRRIFRPAYGDDRSLGRQLGPGAGPPGSGRRLAIAIVASSSLLLRGIDLLRVSRVAPFRGSLRKGSRGEGGSGIEAPPPGSSSSDSNGGATRAESRIAALREVVNSNGGDSAWADLPPEQVRQYFTAEERAGLETRNCGDVHDDALEKKWLGQAQGNPASQHSGPCCPNGHTYGWLSVPLSDTRPLRQVEVRGGGRKTPPFQIRTFLEALRGVRHAFKEKSLDASYDVFLVGDSTMRQAFFGLLCGLARIGGNVTQCTTKKAGQYNHPLCREQNDPVLYGNNMTDASGKTLKLTHARIEIGNDAGNASASPMTMTLRLYQPTNNAVHHKHFADVFMNGNRSPPDLVLVNAGLHARTPGQLHRQLTQTLQHFPRAVLKKTVFRSTTVPHFPDVNSTGSYELFEQQRVNTSIFDRCADIVRADNWRNAAAVDFFRSSNPFWQGRHHLFNDTEDSLVIPVLDMTKSETHYYKTYGGINGEGKLDCVHHIYTPLYWDSFFLRLALVLYEQYQ